MPRAPLHSGICTYKLDTRVRVFYMIFSSMFMGEHESSICGYKGPTMFRGEYESSICDYKGPTMFDLGLLRTLGQV